MMRVIKVQIGLFGLLAVSSIVASYTLVLKPVKSTHPIIKLYRYDGGQSKIVKDGNSFYIIQRPVGGQRTVYVTEGNLPNWIRGPANTEKRKVNYPHQLPFTTNRPIEGTRLYQDIHPRVPAVSNKLEDDSERKENYVTRIPLTSKENGLGTYDSDRGPTNKPEEWTTAGKPFGNSESSGESSFLSSPVYLKIRHEDALVRVPQSEPYTSSSISLSDHRNLGDTLNIKPVTEVNDEFYDYNHGQGKFSAQSEVYFRGDYTQTTHLPPQNNYTPFPENITTIIPETQDGALTAQSEPQVTQNLEAFSITSDSRSQSYAVRQSITPSSPPLTTNLDKNNSSYSNTSYIATTTLPPTQTDFHMTNAYDWTEDSNKISSRYRQEDLNSTESYLSSKPTVTPIIEITTFRPTSFITHSPQNSKDYRHNLLLYKNTKHVQINKPYKPIPPYHATPLPVPTDDPAIQTTPNKKITLPTIGFINSLTTAHYGKENTASFSKDSKPRHTKALNLTQVLTYLRTNKPPKSLKPPKLPAEGDIAFFEPMKLKRGRINSLKPTKETHRITVIKERAKRSPGDEFEEGYQSDLVDLAKTREIADKERKYSGVGTYPKGKYRTELEKEIANKGLEIFEDAFETIGVKKDIKEVAGIIPEQFKTSEEIQRPPPEASESLEEVSEDSQEFPEKSARKLKFHGNREKCAHCPESRPKIDSVKSSGLPISKPHFGGQQHFRIVKPTATVQRIKHYNNGERTERIERPAYKEKSSDYISKPAIEFTQHHRKYINTPNGAKNYSTYRFPPKPKDYKTVTEPTYYRSNFSSETKTPLKLQPNGYLKKYPFKAQPQPPFPKKPKIPNEKPREIPVTEVVDEAPPKSMNPKARPVLNPIHNVAIAKNCKDIVHKLVAFNGKKNIIMNCKDVVITQLVIDGEIQVKVAPRLFPSIPNPTNGYWSQRISPDPSQNDWVPIVGYTRTSDSAEPPPPTSYFKKKENLHDDREQIEEQESSEEENVSEEENASHAKYSSGIQSKPRKKRESNKPKSKSEYDEDDNETEEDSEEEEDDDEEENYPPGAKDLFEKILKESQTSRPLVPKRTLKRLSGKDFLVRYHKSKAKQETTSDFWKVTPTTPIDALVNFKPKTTETNIQIETTTEQPKTSTLSSDQLKDSSNGVTTIAPVQDNLSKRLKPLLDELLKEVSKDNIKEESVELATATEEARTIKKYKTPNVDNLLRQLGRLTPPTPSEETKRTQNSNNVPKTLQLKESLDTTTALSPTTKNISTPPPTITEKQETEVTTANTPQNQRLGKKTKTSTKGRRRKEDFKSTTVSTPFQAQKLRKRPSTDVPFPRNESSVQSQKLSTNKHKTSPAEEITESSRKRMKNEKTSSNEQKKFSSKFVSKEEEGTTTKENQTGAENRRPNKKLIKKVKKLIGNSRHRTTSGKLTANDSKQIENPAEEFLLKEESGRGTTLSTNSLKKSKDEPEKISVPEFAFKHSRKFEFKQSDDLRKIQPSNLIPEQITKKPEMKTIIELDPSNEENSEETTPSTETSHENVDKDVRQEVTERPVFSEKVQPKNENPTKPTFKYTKTGTLKYQTIIRGKPNKENRKEEEEISRFITTSEGPILYYVIDEETGNGKWITDYEDTKKGLSKDQKQSHRVKDKKRKKT